MADMSVLTTAERRWREWATAPAGVRTRRRWGHQHQALAGWTVAELQEPSWTEEVDEMQAALVSLAQLGDQDAALTLIVQLLPGLRSLTRWVAATGLGCGGRTGQLDEAAGEVLSALGERILAHSLARRPSRIATNLLLDTRQRMWRSGTSHHRTVQAALSAAAVVPQGPQPYRPEAVVGELVLTTALVRALDRLPGDRCSRATTAEVAYRAWILDQRRTDIGLEVGLAAEAVSSRLCRLRSALRRELARQELTGREPAGAAAG